MCGRLIDRVGCQPFKHKSLKSVCPISTTVKGPPIRISHINRLGPTPTSIYFLIVRNWDKETSLRSCDGTDGTTVAYRHHPCISSDQVQLLAVTVGRLGWKRCSTTTAWKRAGQQPSYSSSRIQAIAVMATSSPPLRSLSA